MKYGVYSDKNGTLIRYGSCLPKILNKQPYDPETETMIIIPKSASPYDPRGYAMDIDSEAHGFKKLKAKDNAP
ncbi:MAG: hypothetical protein GY934_22040 [Gammaproteobacteria bacterium]|nr:hypothetical protein [Gammaproteobacteria bacterium]